MKIVFVTTEYTTEGSFDGGLANYLNRITNILSKLEQEVIVIVASNCDEVININSIKVVKVNVNSILIEILNKITFMVLNNTLIWLYTSYCLNKKCKDFRNVDVVQYSSYCATALFRNASVPSVVRISSYEKLWQKAYNNKFSLDVNLTTILERIALKKVNKVYGPSKFISEIISKDIDIKIDVIEPQFEKYNGILNESLYNKMVCGKKYLLFYGTIGRLKGVDLIADILFEILSKYSDLIFVFVGKDTTYNNISMINYIYNKAGKFRDRVLYLGKLKHSALIPIIINSFAVILPSRIDNLPNACIEAMAYGKVVVASTKSSFDQLIDSGINGFLFENGDSTSLLNTINMVLSKNAYDIKKMEFLATKTTLRLEDENNIKKLIEYYGTVINGYYEKTDSKANWRISK